MEKIKVIRSLRRTMTLQILPDKTLVVKAPLFLPQFEIDRFIKKHEGWVKKRLETITERKKANKKFQEGEEFLFLGKIYILKIGNYKQIEFKDNFLLFPNFLVFRKEKELNGWYINQAKLFITNQVEKYAFQMKANYKSIMFSDTRSKWGTCFADNRLQFSWRLIMAPILVINYVIIHELAHTFEKNHGRRFWSKVRLFNPSFRQQIKWLKSHGNTLIS